MQGKILPFGQDDRWKEIPFPIQGVWAQAFLAMTELKRDRFVPRDDGVVKRDGFAAREDAPGTSNTILTITVYPFLDE